MWVGNFLLDPTCYKAWSFSLWSLTLEVSGSFFILQLRISQDLLELIFGSVCQIKHTCEGVTTESPEPTWIKTFNSESWCGTALVVFAFAEMDGFCKLKNFFSSTDRHSGIAFIFAVLYGPQQIQPSSLPHNDFSPNLMGSGILTLFWELIPEKIILLARFLVMIPALSDYIFWYIFIYKKYFLDISQIYIL